MHSIHPVNFANWLIHWQGYRESWGSGMVHFGIVLFRYAGNKLLIVTICDCLSMGSKKLLKDTGLLDRFISPIEFTPLTLPNLKKHLASLQGGQLSTEYKIINSRNSKSIFKVTSVVIK